MKLRAIVHDAEEDGNWAEVPAITGCATQGETFEELLGNLYKAVDGCLSVDAETPAFEPRGRVLEIAEHCRADLFVAPRYTDDDVKERAEFGIELVCLPDHAASWTCTKIDLEQWDEVRCSATIGASLREENSG